MAMDERDILEVLKFELNFLEQGGYGRSVHTPWRPTSIFQDSITCLNFGDPARPHPCSECLLMQFVPHDLQGEQVPCHHIALNDKGETVDSMSAWDTQRELEEQVKRWLRATIQRIEAERATKGSARGAA
jgi:uncharacterized small protein (DUF1192 family)